jgi:1-acyl-sn-glycerol-3-phosphate acyltransferase
MSEMNEPEVTVTDVRCAATTRAGTQCKNNAQPGSPYCHMHQTLVEPAGSNGQPEVPEATEPSPPAEDTREELAEELDDLIAELREASPEFTPPPFSPQDIIATLKKSIRHMPPPMQMDILYRMREAVRVDNFDIEAWRGTWFLMNYWNYFQEKAQQSPAGQQALGALAPYWQKLQGAINEDLLDIDTWKGLWFMVSYSVQYQVDILKRRATGDYYTDEWGLDWEFLDAVRPLLSFFYKYYWRVSTNGMENIPDAGRAMLVMNHSGQLPFDAAMVLTAVLMEHPSQRLVRHLYGDFVPGLPFLSSAIEKIGGTLAREENGVRLLEQEELVGVFPEGYKGISKLFKDRYRLARFGRGGFVQMALRTQAPIIPAAIVGAEEIYVAIHQSRSLARMAGLPFFSISLRFPWLGLLGVVPLPTRWTIDFGEPIPTDEYGPQAADDPLLVSQMTDQVRNVVQEMIHARLAQRRSPFW